MTVKFSYGEDTLNMQNVNKKWVAEYAKFPPGDINYTIIAEYNGTKLFLHNYAVSLITLEKFNNIIQVLIILAIVIFLSILSCLIIVFTIKRKRKKINEEIYKKRSEKDKLVNEASNKLKELSERSKEIRNIFDDVSEFQRDHFENPSKFDNDKRELDKLYSKISSNKTHINSFVTDPNKDGKSDKKILTLEEAKQELTSINEGINTAKDILKLLRSSANKKSIKEKIDSIEKNIKKELDQIKKNRNICLIFQDNQGNFVDIIGCSPINDIFEPPSAVLLLSDIMQKENGTLTEKVRLKNDELQKLTARFKDEIGIRFFLLENSTYVTAKKPFIITSHNEINEETTVESYEEHELLLDNTRYILSIENETIYFKLRRKDN